MRDQADDCRLADPYACVSLLLVEDGISNGVDLISCLDHNVSKSNRKEHETTRNGNATRMINPMRRTKVVNQCLDPKWRQVFHFDGARSAKMDMDGVLQVSDAEIGNMGGRQLVALVTIHDHDFLQADDFGGRCVISVAPGLTDRVWIPLVDNNGSKIIGKSGRQAHVALQFDYSVALLLNKPDMTKHNDEGRNHRFKFCAASMQGWRTTMEDAHVGLLRFGGKHDAFFGVFDGVWSPLFPSPALAFFILPENFNHVR